MFSSLVLAALLAPLALVRADPNPTAPGPNTTFNAGAQCTIAWDADTTGVWKVMNIELMSGDNLAMVYMTTVATVDGTDASNTTFSYPCPAVAPNAPIYFYQFTSPFSKQIYWTTRFTIADSNGNTVPAPTPTQPGGQPTPWGVGALSDPSLANAEPTFGESAAPAPASTGSGSPATGAPSSPAPTAPSSGAGAPSSGAPSGSPPSGSTSDGPSGSSPASSSNKGSTVAGGATNTTSAGGPKPSNTDNAALAGASIDSRLLSGVVALGVAAITFAVTL